MASGPQQRVVWFAVVYASPGMDTVMVPLKSYAPVAGSIAALGTALVAVPGDQGACRRSCLKLSMLEVLSFGARLPPWSQLGLVSTRVGLN